ncbi:phenylacetate-CoA oxygenase subunit PaaI [Nocardia panacis]|uniref:Phenylacetate-CoA oxygenase subunit PaaI n=1 Tax=Nocardia panacis TaxID=2340916 RepID=A0A3A4KKN7_9NOCA|nr:1,2-phenylacetyl-CoA epoxidase subunit PaaC [Nocardia panacis]RJO73557.1 phenylacetate-CoA oxygenase subunit PaaI [Nocardia panacis]
MIDHDNPFDGLVGGDGDGRWAFGTDFDDPLAGVDTTVPRDVDLPALARYCLMLGDDALIGAQRLIEFVTHAPELEEEVAFANIGLDLLGQARLLLARAAAADPSAVPRLPESSPIPDEDALAFFRAESQFRNVRLCELDNGDFAQTVVRTLVLTTWRLAVFARLRDSRDPVLAAVAHKGVKELTYHRDYAARWTVVLGGGTPESQRRLGAALRQVWPFLPELFVGTEDERALAAVGVAVDPAEIAAEVEEILATILGAAEVEAPEGVSAAGIAGRAGRQGVHTEGLGRMLAEMQSVAREHPEGVW